MNTLRDIEMGPIPVRTALLVGGDPDIDSQLRRILEPGLWALQHVSDNAAALVMALRKNFDQILNSDKKSGKEDVKLIIKL